MKRNKIMPKYSKSCHNQREINAGKKHTNTLLTVLFNKLTSVFHASVLLLIMNFVIRLQISGSKDYFDDVMTKVIVNSRTDA